LNGSEIENFGAVKYSNGQAYGWIRLRNHCCRRYHFIFVYVQWIMKIKWYSLQQWLHKRIHPMATFGQTLLALKIYNTRYVNAAYDWLPT